MQHHYPSSTHLKLVSLTGPDDRTDISHLQSLAFDYPWVEWAILYVPHNEGAPRNPTRSWREQYFETVHPASTAVHWCGKMAFEQLLNGNFPSELVLANRWQLNINARKSDFDDEAIIEIIECALTYKPNIILQYHEGSEIAIQHWIKNAASDRVGILLDSSKGKGVAIDDFSFPAQFENVYIGRAGGIDPSNIEYVLKNLDAQATSPYWIDMESGVRTENQFDMSKAIAILEASTSYIR